MGRRAITTLAVSGLAAALLTGCGGGETLPGRGYQPPSESTAPRTVPLTVPPDYGLRPGDVEERSASGGGTVIAERDTGDVALPDSTPGERVLLAQSGAFEADPAIRDTLNHENARLVGRPQFVEVLLFGSHPPGGADSGVSIERFDGETGWLAGAWDSLGY